MCFILRSRLTSGSTMILADSGILAMSCFTSASRTISAISSGAGSVRPHFGRIASAR